MDRQGDAQTHASGEHPASTRGGACSHISNTWDETLRIDRTCSQPKGARSAKAEQVRAGVITSQCAPVDMRSERYQS